MVASLLSYVTVSAVRLLALSFCAALLLIEHVRFAMAARRDANWRVALLALLVPFAGVALAWQRGARRAPFRYAVLITAYAALWVTS